MQSCERIFVPNWLFFAIRVICVSQQFVCIFVDSILLLFFIRFLFVVVVAFAFDLIFFSLLSWCLRCAHFCATFVPLFFFHSFGVWGGYVIYLLFSTSPIARCCLFANFFLVVVCCLECRKHTNKVTDINETWSSQRYHLCIALPV